jgi:hypothetical protein
MNLDHGVFIPKHDTCPRITPSFVASTHDTLLYPHHTTIITTLENMYTHLLISRYYHETFVTLNFIATWCSLIYGTCLAE